MSVEATVLIFATRYASAQLRLPPPILRQQIEQVQLRPQDVQTLTRTVADHLQRVDAAQAHRQKWQELHEWLVAQS